jgi:hypothetical protein
MIAVQELDGAHVADCFDHHIRMRISCVGSRLLLGLGAVVIGDAKAGNLLRPRAVGAVCKAGGDAGFGHGF